jgi:hypothetical protein
MRQLLASTLIVLLAVVEHAVPLAGCGEKLMVLGRGVRFQSRHTPRAASVLLYLPQTASGQPLSDPHLESALREAGHAVHAVTTSADLQTELRRGVYDVVLANIADTPDLERAQTAPDANSVVLPAVYLVAPPQRSKERTKLDRERASKVFGVVVDVPGRPGQYCAAVDKAMEIKLKNEHAAKRRP